MIPRFLSKSKYLNGLQCLKYLWLSVNDREKVPAPDAGTQHIFDQGHLVGELAQKLFPGGISVPTDNFMRNVNRTKELLKESRPIFEGGILAENVYSRLDILRPAGHGKWDIIEVKSSTKVKEENLHDVSFQKLCCEKQGLTVNTCYLAYINNQFVKSGDIDPEQLFVVQDITNEVNDAGIGIEDRTKIMFETIASAECPNTPVGSHCNDPYGCPVTVCWEELPGNNILDLYRGGGKRFDWLHGGILRIKDIPTTAKLSEPQKIQKWCDTNCAPYVNKELISDFLSSLKHPLHYLDFETYNAAIPLVDGTKPYQQVPFQFSLHIVNGQTERRHLSFLADGAEDSRPEFLRELRKGIGDSGSIITYNQSFEEGILRNLSQAFPEYADWVDGICARLVDLLTPFRNFSYYHPEQRGSASIKSVLPALTGKGYDEMIIGSGDAASLAYLKITFGDTSEEEKKQVRTDLEKYCGLDTEGMIWIVEKLKEVIQS